MTPDIAEIDTTDAPAGAGDGFWLHNRPRNRPSSPAVNRIEIIAETTTRRQVTHPASSIRRTQARATGYNSIKRSFIVHNTITPSDVRAALRALQTSNADPALALEFVALTASHITPVRLARLTDIDIDNAIWRIPAQHAKSRVEQQIPLSRDALSVLKRAERINRGDSDLVFPSRRGTALSANTLSNLCKKLNLNTRPFQFRAAFAVWCADSTVPPDIAEAALGYKLPFRTPFWPAFLERRRPLMQAWADLLAGDLPDDWRWREPGQDEDISEEELFELKQRLKSQEEKLSELKQQKKSWEKN